MNRLFEQLHDSVQAKDYNKISDILADMSIKLQLDMPEMDEDEKKKERVFDPSEICTNCG